MGRLRPRVSKGLSSSKTIYIFCEGKTEEVYFSKLNQMTNKSSVKVIPKEAKKSALELVQFAVRAKRAMPSEVYIVFDKDLNSDAKIEQAYSLARQHGFNIHFTNVCFELWFLLHYQKVSNQSLSDNQLYQKINQHINIKDYKDRKAELKLVHDIAKHFPTAIENNEALLKVNNYWKTNPYSDISVLIKRIFL